MAIRWKIIALILGTTLLLNLGVYLVSHSTMFMEFVAVEDKLARDHIDRVRNSLQDDLDSLVSLNVDWSAWDDTYEFVSDNNNEYIESNLVQSTFDELSLNAIIFIDRKGQIVYSGGYDSEEEIIAPLPEKLSASLTSKSPLLDHTDPESRLAGIISLPGGMFLVSSCPIIKSDMSGPIAGSLIMGRFLDQEQLDRLVRQTRLSIILSPFSQSSETNNSLASPELHHVDSETIEGRIVLQDIYGQNAYLLNINIPRDVSRQGRSTLNSFLLWNILLTLAAAGVIYLVIDRWLRSREDRLESDERFRSMFVHSEAGMCTVSKAGKILQVNAAFCRILGYPEEKLIGEELPQLVNPMDRGWLSSLFSIGGKSRGLGGSFDCRFMHESGRTVWSKVSIGWVSLFKNRPHYAVLMLQDVSDRKRVEDHLKVALKSAQDAQERSKAILRSAADGLILVDQDNKIVMVNPAAEAMLDHSSHDMTHRNIESIIDSACLKKMLGMIQRGECPGEPCDVAFSRGTKGDLSHLRFYAAPVVDKSGRREGIIITLHDLTRDIELDQMKNDFISTAAHEIRSPLTAVKGFSELLLDEKAFNLQERQTYIGYIYEKSQALACIVDELLNLERINSGRKVILNTTSVKFKPLVSKIMEQFEKTWTEHEFALDFPPGDIFLNIDPKKIEQVLDNVLRNSVKYSPVGGKVVIKGKYYGNEFRLCIEDQGVGMTADDLNSVFNKFFRSPSTASLTEGVGLGLTISKEIVEAHGGRIWLNSVYGEGTRVYVSLPA